MDGGRKMRTSPIDQPSRKKDCLNFEFIHRFLYYGNQIRRIQDNNHLGIYWCVFADADTSSGRVIDFDKLEGPQNDKLRKLTILDEPRFPTFLKESDTKTGLTGPALVIKPGVLKQGWTYIIELKVSNTGTTKS